MASRKILYANFVTFILFISGSRISSFLKTSLVQINSKLNEKNRMISFTNMPQITVSDYLSSQD